MSAPPRSRVGVQRLRVSLPTPARRRRAAPWVAVAVAAWISRTGTAFRPPPVAQVASLLSSAARLPGPPAAAAGSARALAAGASHGGGVTLDCGQLGFVDTHCHLDAILPRLASERKRDAKKAEARGQPPPAPLGTGFDAWRASLEGPEKDLEACITIGCAKKTFAPVESLLGHAGVVAWGECGLDYHDKDTGQPTVDEELKALQRRVFARQIELAVAAGKPLVVHTRSADDDTWEVLSQHLPESHPVHVHCFTSSPELAAKLLDRFPRLNLGFTGVVTFKNAGHVKDVVRDTPLDRILLETDGPYMAPVPFRGKIAHPGHVAYVARAVAELKGVPLSDVLCTCRANTRRLYGV